MRSSEAPVASGEIDSMARAWASGDTLLSGRGPVVVIGSGHMTFSVVMWISDSVAGA